MRWESLSCAAVIAAAALVVTGCDRLQLGPQRATSAPAESPSAAPRASLDLRAHTGETFSDFIANAGANYAPDVLGLNAADRTRLWRAMAASDGAELQSGGGAEALLFKGCASGGCAEGMAIVAVDTSTGLAFVGVRDVGGAAVLTPNDRVEALLRLNSPTRNWDDPGPPSTLEATAGP